MGDVPPAPALGAQWHGTEGPRLLPLLCGSARNLIKISTPWQTTLGSVVFFPILSTQKDRDPVSGCWFTFAHLVGGTW